MRSWEALKAEDLMKSPVLAVDVGTPLAEAAKMMSDNHVSGLLVNDGGRPVGVVSLLDLVSFVAGLERLPGEPGGFYRLGEPKFAQGAEGWDESFEEKDEEPFRERTVGEIMSPEIITVAPKTPAPQVAKLLWERRIHRVFVAGPKGPQGVISSLDVLGLLAALPKAKASA